ncbi:MAG: Tim44 domain-containing protein [Syntrophorhabdaceae bacterium]|nr:Tim44 domain-containing protein [Syntrophorhabdaceae bacterium]
MTYSEPQPEGAYDNVVYENPVASALRHIKEMDPAFDENRFKELAEDMFFKIQGAWTRRDLTSIQNIISPELMRHFKREIDEYLEKGLVNRLENIAIRQVEIVDAGQRFGEEYITVKFLASLLDYKIDEKTNQIISGSAIEPVKFIEYWTFQRKIGDKNWVLGGITQESDYYSKDMVQ